MAGGCQRHRKICRRCCGRLSLSMPGTRLKSCSTPPGSAVFSPPKSCATPALTTAAHLAAINLGLKSIPRERRRHRHRETRLLAILEGISAAASLGLKEHDRLTLARQMMEHRLTGRRQSSKLPELIDLVISRPMVSTGMIAKEIGVTPRAALRIVEELNLREMTGRGRFRAWGIM